MLIMFWLYNAEPENRNPFSPQGMGHIQNFKYAYETQIPF